MQTAEGQALIQRSRDEGVPLLRRLPGFIRYQGASTGPRTTVQVFEWESEGQALTGAEHLLAAGDVLDLPLVDQRQCDVGGQLEQLGLGEDLTRHVLDALTCGENDLED